MLREAKVAVGESYERGSEESKMTPRHVWAALGAGTLALVAAVLVAVGPANVSRSVYRWPAAAPAAGSPAQPPAGNRMAFAPLLLSNRTPARLSVDVPCAVVASAIPVGSQRFTVLATANDVRSARALWLVAEGGKLRLGVGGAGLAEGPWPRATLDDPGCIVSAGFRGREWQLDIGHRELGRGRHLAPVVTGLFTQLPQPLEGTRGLAVQVVTSVDGSTPSSRQVLLTVVAVAAGATALILLVTSCGRRRKRRSARDRSARAPSTVHWLAWVDAVVVVGLLAWWALGPVLYDDGWIQSVVLNFSKSGAFTNYYQVFSAQYPLGFLHFLLLFGWSRASGSLLWMRLPALVMGLAMWTLLRVYLGRLRVVSCGASRVALALAFLLCWFAWLSTLRPEPLVALLSVVVLVAVQRFYRTAAVGALATAALAATVALAVHPEGVIAVAPLLVAVPALWRWTRDRGVAGVFTVVALGFIAAAVLVLLVTADTDLTQWRHNQHLFATQQWLDPRIAHPVTLSWRDEPLRYQLLFQPGLYSTVARRATAAFAVVPVILFVTRLGRRRNAALDLPVLSLVVGVVLMALTPSKWPWQLGALAGFATLAVAVELGHLALDPIGARSRTRRSLIVLIATLVASVIAWRGGADFGHFSVVTVAFGRGGSDFLGLDLSSPVPWIALGAAALFTDAVIAAWHRRFSLWRAWERSLARTGLWAVPVAVGIIVATTLGLFVTDPIAASPGWSLARQNYDQLTGRTCGIADDYGIADPTMGTQLRPDDGALDIGNHRIPAALHGPRLDFTSDGSPPSEPGFALDTRWGSRVRGDESTGVFFSPWFAIAPEAITTRVDQPGIALFTAGRPSSRGNHLYVEYGRREGRAIRPLNTKRVDAPDSGATWRSSPLDPGPRANRVRLLAVDADTSTDGWLAFSAPRLVHYERLDAILSRPGTTALIGPADRLYFPCATNPTITHGIAHAPDYEIAIFLTPQSPMAGISDLYRSRPLLIRTANGTVGDLAIDRIVKHPGPGEPVPLEHDTATD